MLGYLFMTGAEEALRLLTDLIYLKLRWFCFDYLVLVLININTRLIFLYTSIVLEVFFVSECCTGHVRIVLHSVNFKAVTRSVFVQGRVGILIFIAGYR